MPKIIRIRNTGDIETAAKVLSKIHHRLNTEMPPKVMMEWGKILERDMKASAMDAGIQPFTGTLYDDGIQWRQRPKGKSGALFMRLYGIQLDSMEDHYVKLTTRRTRLLAWAKQANYEVVRDKAKAVEDGAKYPIKIFVRKHPFIYAGWRRARPKLRPLLKQHVKRIMATT